jgi:hypothetical protein
MTPTTSARLVLAAAGLVVWGIGIRAEDSVLQYVGIGLLVVAVVLRFVRRPDPRS